MKHSYSSTKEVSSEAVRVCFCRGNQPDCSYQPQPVSVTKGQMFNVSLVAVDQVNNMIARSTVIHGFVDLPASLGEGQSIQETSENGTCTDLPYSIFPSQNTSFEQLYLYAHGPCMGAGISLANITVNILPCPVGFTAKEKRCDCDPLLTDDKYTAYVHNCSIDDGTVLRRRDVWINHSNVSGYTLFWQCPLQYCVPGPVSINLNIPDGSDAQCAYNRSGKLCGSCKDGLSLTLGGWRCKKCSNNHLALLIVFAIAGILLVGLLLALNLTVAVGPINGLLFYANVLQAIRPLFFPDDEINPVTVFIDWLNLDFGYSGTCFYDGMNSYTYTWLQIVFPIYVILLVVSVIVISQFSTKFATLLSTRNPVATLATLILLSNAAFLRVIILALLFANLEYSDGTEETVWLVDGEVPYMKGKHFFLGFTALVILLVCLVLSFLVFFWQWLLRCPNRKPFKWIHSTELKSFMDAFNAPYSDKYRYWTGMLLFARIGLYILIAVVNVNIKPGINLLSIIFVAGFLLLHIVFGKVYKKWPLQILEASFLMNLIFLCATVLYVRQLQINLKHVNIPAYVFVSVALLTFFCIIVYHIYKFIPLVNKCVGKVGKKFVGKMSKTSKASKNAVPSSEEMLQYPTNPQKEHNQNFKMLRESMLDDNLIVVTLDDYDSHTKTRYKNVGTQTFTTSIIDGPSDSEEN